MNLRFVLFCLAGAALVATGLSALRFVDVAAADPPLLAVAEGADLGGIVEPDLEPDPYTTPKQAEPTVDEVARLWRGGAPLGAGLVALYIVLLAAGRFDPKRAWKWTGSAAAIGMIVEVVRAGQIPTLGMFVAAAGTLAALWAPGVAGVVGASRPPRARTERGAASWPLTVALALGGSALIGIAVGAGCAALKRESHATASDVVDCTTATARAHAAEYGALLEQVILAATAPSGEVDFAPVRAAAAGFGIETGGCALAATIARLLEARVPESTRAAAPGRDELRASWESLRREQLGGRRFKVAGGVL